MAGPAGDESGRIAQLLKNAELWVAVLSFFGFGLLLSLTPCVFPMIPILSGIIVGAGRDGHGVSHSRGFVLSLSYVLGMAVTYAVVGVAAGFTGTLFSAALQNAWVLGGFALLFVVLSFSMFGFYEFQVPTFLQSKVAEETSHIRGGSVPALFVMGGLSAVIVGPCVAAPLAGALLYIGQSGDALLGGVALFAMALGMGVPLLLVGLSAGSLLPKSGPWMDAVKRAFGVVLLAMAVWIVSPLIPLAVQMAAWALLLIVSAVFMRAVDSLPPHAHNWQRFWKGMGIVMLALGVAMLIGALSGAKDPLQPLAGLRAETRETDSRRLPFERVRSVAELDARIAAVGRPVMLDFYADWCVSCKEMERFTFSDPRVQQKLAGFTLLQADVTANSDDDKALLSRFKLFGPPGIIFFDAGGQEIGSVRIVGFQSADEFLRTIALSGL
jgi:thiol:disulfide interchange protein DsbD